jgi:hypothetical protein
MQVIIYRATDRHLHDLYELTGAVGHNEPIALSDTPSPTSSLCLFFSHPGGAYLSLTKLSGCITCYNNFATLIYFAAPKLLNVEPIPTNIQPMLDCMIQCQPKPAKYSANTVQSTGAQTTKAIQRVPPYAAADIMLHICWQPAYTPPGKERHEQENTNE